MTRFSVSSKGYDSTLASWIYLTDWILALILGLTFVFYFARLVGFALSLILKLVVWKKFQVRITVDAFRVSPLGGRITAKNLVISNSDYTISILRFNLTWRYWLLRLTRVSEYFLSPKGDLPEEDTGLTQDQNKKLASSVLLLIDGLEIFMYNRVAAYDNIIEALKTTANGEKDLHFSSDSSRLSDTNSSPPSPKESSTSSSALDRTERPLEDTLKFLLNVFPVQIRIKRGALVVGNPTTPSILVASFKSAVSVLDVCKAPCILDNFRIRYEINMEKFQVSLKPNISYDPLRYSGDETKKPSPHRPKIKHRRFRKIQQAFNRLFSRPSRPELSDEHYAQWRGLRRYVDNFEDERFADLGAIEEYAKYSLILDSVSTQLIYYYDSMGVNPSRNSPLSSGAPNPEFGVDLILSMATINYGSWADRQRGAIQTMLFPPLSRDSKPSEISSEPGDLRKYAGFKFRIHIKDETIVRVPTREFSKDKEVMTNAGNKGQQKITRPFGWLELKFGRNTKISSFTSYLGFAHGWPNTLNCFFSELEIRSSVNHDILFTADEHIIDCDIGFPLKWNGECIWKFRNLSQNGKLFLLREHAILLNDLVSDFASGVPTPYEFYRPFEYKVEWKIENYKLFFNVNDHNIVNDPMDFNSNKYICFSGDMLNVSLRIPLRGSFAKSSTIEFNLVTTGLDVTLEVPPWHTVSAFMKCGRRMGRAESFEVSGSYTFYNAIEVNCSNFAVINAIGDDVSLIFYGYFIRYLFTLRENYFGDFTHFQTLEEYTNGLNTGVKPDIASEETSIFEEDPDYWKRIKAENDLNVLLTFLVRNGLIILPCHIYDYSDHIGLTFDYLDVDIHVNHYYMDLQADFSTGYGHHLTKKDLLSDQEVIFRLTEYKQQILHKSPDITIDGFSVHTHRMFGLAPDLLTYYCKWDFAAGTILIDSDPLCITALKTIVATFALGYKDLENTLIYHVPIVYDAANFTFRCPEFNIRLATGVPDTFLTIELIQMLVSFNDIANQRYSDKIVISIPTLIAKIVNETENKYSAYLKSSLMLTIICQKAKQLEHRRCQQRHVRQSDAPTHRTPFLVFPENKDPVYMSAMGSLFPSVSLPNASVPLTREWLDIEARKGTPSDLVNSSSLEESINDFEMEDRFRATVDYFDDEYCPQYFKRPNFKYDTCVVELETLDVFVSPDGASNFASFQEGLQNLDLDFLIDRLQMETVKTLKVLVMPVSMVDNVRFVCPEVNLRITSEAIELPSQVFCSSPGMPVVTVNIHEPSIAFSHVSERARDGFMINEKASLSLALHVKEVYVSVHDPQFFYPAFTLEFSDIETWLTIDENDDLTTLISLDTLKSTFESTHFKWTIGFVDLLVSMFSTAFEKFAVASETSKVWRSELIYMLTIASKNLSLEYDPGVLTKPSDILRSCEDHVRLYDSWKLITKLRNMLSCLPEGVHEAEVRRFKERKWTNPSDAMNQVIDIFARWRSWEGNKTQRSHYFQTNFCFEEEKKIPQKRMLFRWNQADVNIAEMGHKSDSFVVHGLTANVHNFMAPTQELLPNTAITENVLNTSVFCNVEAMDCFISKTTINTLKVLQEFDALHRSRLPPNPQLTKIEDKILVNKLIFLFLSLKLIHLRVDLPSTCWEIYSLDNMTTCQVMSSDGGDDFLNVGFKFKEFSISFGKESRKHLELTLNDLSVVSSNVDNLMLGTKQFDLKLGNCDLKVLDHENTLTPTIKSFWEVDVKALSELQLRDKGITKEGQHTKKEPNFSLKEIPDFMINLEVFRVSTVVELLHPLRFHSVHLKNKLSVSFCDGIFLLESSYKSVVIDWRVFDSALLRIENSNFEVKSHLVKLDDLWMVTSDVNLGYLKITNSLMVNSVDSVLKNKTAIEKRLSTLQEIVETPKGKDVAPVPEVEKSQTGNAWSKKVAFRLNLSQEYVGVSTYKEQCRYTIEFEGLSVAVSNVACNKNESKAFIVPTWGEIIIPATRITILDPLISVGLSTLVEFNVSAKVLNDTTMKTESAQSLQVESQYFRVCFNPLVLFKIFEMADAVTHLLTKNDLLYKKPVKVKAIEEDVPPKEPQQESSSERLIPNFSSVHVLAHNFCLGWLFGTSHKDYPGIILGAERFFAVTKGGMGKLTLMEGYLSVANGSTASSFYSTLSEMNNLNRAFMPKLQLNYCITDENKIWISLKGDELDVRFMSNSIIIVERAVKSGSNVQGYFQQRAKELERRKRVSARLQQIVPKEKPVVRRLFTPKFSCVQCNVVFAGSKVLFYRLLEDDMHDSPPSLSLQSPAVLLALFYQHTKERVKKHNVKIEVTMSKSDNTLYASCVPVVMDFIEASKLMLRTRQPNEDKDTTPEFQSDEQTVDQNETINSIAKVLQDFDFHLGFIIHKQRLSFSCEPTAKVAAIVETDGASIMASSGLEDASSIYCLVRLNSVSASLQHIYSDERSGFLEISNIMFADIVSFDPSIDIVSSGSFSDVSGYVRMKQYQDLDLFKDIWYPKKYQFTNAESTKEEPTKLLSHKSSTSRFKVVSTTSAIPLAITFIISNFSLEVDFGAALGVVVLDVDRAWAVSRKTSDWYCDIKLGFQNMIVGSDGRLGGYLKIERAFLHSAIEWKLKDLPFLDVPLIVFSSGFDKFHLKTSFDDHVFAIANIENWTMDVFNRKDGINISKDHLFVLTKFDTAEIFVTSLAASDFYDIYSTISRMVEEKRTSYKEILKDSNKEHLIEEVATSELLEVVKKLETKIEVIAGSTRIQVYPQSFDDTRVLVIELDKSKAFFLQNEYTLGVSNEIELQFNNLKASLSTPAGVTPEEIQKFGVDEFVEYARKARGGAIFVFPKFMISMRTFQKYNTNIVEYLYQSSFGGTVDVRWNLGAINCVREMYAAHKRAFNSRTEYSKRELPTFKDGFEMKEKMFELDQAQRMTDFAVDLFSNSTPHKDIDKDINDTLEKVANESKFTYLPLAPPVIEAPQLKELGNATPPLEWFGLHRSKFPDATHQFAIVTLQKLIHEIDQQYCKTLGKA